MPHIVLDCPHCDAQQMTMPVHHRVLNREKQGIAYAQCARCRMPVVAIVEKGPKFRLAGMEVWLKHGHDVVSDPGVSVVSVIPEVRNPVVPDHVPNDTARVYMQAENARKRGDSDAAGMAFRKALDIGLKEYDSSLSGNLRKRIDALADAHVITKSMKDWAHQIRFLGNESAHEPNEPDQSEINALADFTETLLKYLFTLPVEVEQRKASMKSQH